MTGSYATFRSQVIHTQEISVPNTLCVPDFPSFVPTSFITWHALYLHFSMFPHNLKYHHPLSRVCLCGLIPPPCIRTLGSRVLKYILIITTKALHTLLCSWVFSFPVYNWVRLLWRGLNEYSQKYYVFFYSYRINKCLCHNIYYSIFAKWTALSIQSGIHYFHWCWYCYIQRETVIIQCDCFSSCCYLVIIL